MSGTIQEYLEMVRERLASRSGYAATVVTGSLASDDFVPKHSDVDLIVVFDAGLPEATKTDVTGMLSHATLPCPAKGLDLVAYAASEIINPSFNLHFDFSISTGEAWRDDISFGGPYPGGLIDLALARESGHSLEGIAVQGLIGPVNPKQLQFELANSIRWHLDKIHDPFHDPFGINATLNACRALYFMKSGSLVSKSQGARHLLEQAGSALAEQALRMHRRPDPARLPKEEVVAFLTAAILKLSEGAS